MPRRQPWSPFVAEDHGNSYAHAVAAPPEMMMEATQWVITFPQKKLAFTPNFGLKPNLYAKVKWQRSSVLNFSFKQKFAVNFGFKLVLNWS